MFSTFDNLVEKHKAVQIHVTNLQLLGTKMFQIKNGIAPKLLNDITKVSNPTYDLRNKRDFVSNYAKTVYFSIEFLSYLSRK